jgi:adenylosuccinate lyase
MHALSPLDGRYQESVRDVASHFSEFALMRERCRVEIAHALQLEDAGIFPPLKASERAALQELASSFGETDYQRIKLHEQTLRHDVKACEVFLRERVPLENPNRYHFALTSEDVNNLAYASMIRGYIEHVQRPLWRAVLADLAALAQKWRSAPFPARTHGQHATPSTAGKEMAVMASRWLRGLSELREIRLSGKLNGATGNYSAAKAAAPHVDWRAYEDELVTSMGFVRNPATTQIEDHGSMTRYFDLVRRQCAVATDLCLDMWMYISYGYVVQKSKAGEVGSSTMPHKVNPIRFENAEGNLQLASSMLSFLSDKLNRSRMQRDLSESTVMRNIGVALGHQHLALLELRKGLESIALDEARCRQEVSEHPELLSEAVQTVLRLVRTDDVYTELKAMTRGKAFTAQDLARVVASLPQDKRALLRDMTPTLYLGDAERIVDEVVRACSL